MIHEGILRTCDYEIFGIVVIPQVGFEMWTRVYKLITKYKKLRFKQNKGNLERLITFTFLDGH